MTVTFSWFYNHTVTDSHGSPIYVTATAERAQKMMLREYSHLTEDDIPLVVLRMHDLENPFDIAPNGFDDTYDDAGFVAAATPRQAAGGPFAVTFGFAFCAFAFSRRNVCVSTGGPTPKLIGAVMT